ncbi:MAG TPA: cell wall-binding repeat-containing protein [Desulfosporosinus sp.]
MHLFTKRLISSVLTLILTFSLSIPVFGNTATNAHRLAGYDRYDTAAAIAKEGWTQSDYAILVNGENFPDALVATFVAKQYNAPILLSQKDFLPQVTKQMLIDLKVKKVILIGGKAVLGYSHAVFQNMGIEPSQWAGEDRYDTSIVAASRFPNVTEIVIATGEDFADALSVSSIAAYKNMPIILVPKDTIGRDTQAFIKQFKLTKTYVIGDADIISESVTKQFPNPERITGATKYDRNINIINRFRADINGKNVFIATGNNYADALAGSAYAAKTNSPIVLVGNILSSSTRTYLNSSLAGKTVYILGGEGAVSSSTFNDSSSRTYQQSATKELANPLLKLGYTKEKYALVFGSLENDAYQSASEAEANMINISIDVWQLNASGEKYSAKRTLTVNKSVADTVKTVFKEIFEGQDKFPIYSVQGYAWRGDNTSEHNWGLAIDINPKENYMITSGGVIVAGSFWDPAKSLYSIPEKGNVVTTFNKYGFTWGGNAWKSSHDYMHFSYLGK